MQAPGIPENEEQRLKSLYITSLLDTRDDERFERLTRLARKAFQVPVALIGSVALRLRQVTCCFFVMLPIVTVNVSDPKYLQTSALSRRRYCSVCPLVSGLLTESA